MNAATTTPSKVEPAPGRRYGRRSKTRRFRRSPLSRVGVVLLLLVVVFTVVGPFVYTASPTLTHPADALQGPSATYPLGTDELGRDILARLIHAGLVSIPAGMLAVGIGAIAGILIGTAAGYIGGVLDSTVMRIVDVMLSFPTMLTAIVVVAILGPSIQTAILAVSIAALPSYARVARSSVLPLRQSSFIEAASVSNTPRTGILFRHVLPNAMDVLLVLLVIGIGNGMIILSALSFLGIGVQPPQADWGVMLTQGVDNVYLVPISAIAPAVMLLITVLGINFVGEGLGAALRVDSQGAVRRKASR